nr:MAG TPA: hypothetical protein [Caudoviricetes sp.]
MHDLLSDIKDAAATFFSIVSSIALIWDMIDRHHHNGK